MVLDLGVGGAEVTLKTIGGNGVGKKDSAIFFPRWLMIGRTFGVALGVVSGSPIERYLKEKHILKHLKVFRKFLPITSFDSSHLW